ncbi:hypothetical protein P3T76_006571 [Phytophthora citrophthora]|uniref:Uncharacterized protein n=1 Tax=Phytophthora citrophthora TaxID=4793 RepID=A0AAD9LPL7_9STRA|nr:hypothetical protein P3T76_006571 [Phytophthora citrophthora]
MPRLWLQIGVPDAIRPVYAAKMTWCSLDPLGHFAWMCVLGGGRLDAGAKPALSSPSWAAHYQELLRSVAFELRIRAERIEAVGCR